MAESNPPTNTTPAPEPAVEKTDITGTTTTSSQTPPPPPPSEDKPSDAPVEPAAPPAAVPEPPKNDNVGDETKSVATTALTLISSGPVWPTLEENHPLAKFQARLPELLAAAEHAQIWGITLSAATPIPFHTTLILQKFLRANYNDVDKAYKQLLDTLKWRRKENPEGAVEEIFSEVKYDGLGYITKIKTKEGDEKVVTWNIYGACKDTRSTFGDLDGFLRWRIALMELGIAALNLPSATVPIPDYNDASPGSAIDPYQMIQLHDYRSVSFIRMDSATKTASRKTIEVMAAYYPELLSAKLFVNVPMVMSWVFTAMKAFLSKETLRKFKVVSSGKSVVNELGEDVPKIYGGKGEELRLVGNGPKLAPDVPTPEKRSADNLPVEKEKEKVAEKEKSLPSTPAVTAAPSSEATAPATPPKEPEGTAAQPSEPTAAISTIPEAKEEEEAATKSETAPPPPPPQKDTVPEAATAPAPAVEATPAPLTEPKEQVVSEIRQEAAPAAEPTPTTTETPAKEETVLNEKLPVAAETEANAEQTPAPAPVAIPATQEVIISEKSEVVVMPESTTTAPATEAAAVMA